MGRQHLRWVPLPIRSEPPFLTLGPEGMHGLVVDCRVLERLVEDRPQIAASMLGTLAEILAAAEAPAR